MVPKVAGWVFVLIGLLGLGGFTIVVWTLLIMVVLGADLHVSHLGMVIVTMLASGAIGRWSLDLGRRLLRTPGETVLQNADGCALYLRSFEDDILQLSDDRFSTSVSHEFPRALVQSG